jgi:hypothetical protein
MASSFSVRSLVNEPFPLAYVGLPKDFDESDLEAPINEFELIGAVAELFGKERDEFRGCTFRGVSASRLPVVLRSGIDVEPTDSAIYAHYFDKAWEYGGFPKLVLALDMTGLDRTYKELPEDADGAEIEELRQTYPTRLTTEDRTIWLTRLQEDDPHAATQYEWGYGWWIPGDPIAVLRFAVVFGRSSEDLRKVLADIGDDSRDE